MPTNPTTNMHTHRKPMLKIRPYIRIMPLNLSNPTFKHQRHIRIKPSNNTSRNTTNQIITNPNAPMNTPFMEKRTQKNIITHQYPSKTNQHTHRTKHIH
jgi:hypothetical protein